MANRDDKKTAGKDQSKTQQTTKQAEENEVPTSVEERGETDAKAAAEGSTVGAVVDGDTGLDNVDEDDDFEFDAVEDDEVPGALGTVAERNLDGDEFDVPWTYVTATDVARTSDSDDPARSWTAQEVSEERKDDDGNDLDPVALVDVVREPGQTFRVRELPNRDVVEAAGINYEQFVAGLPVRADVPNEAPRKGVPA